MAYQRRKINLGALANGATGSSFNVEERNLAGATVFCRGGVGGTITIEISDDNSAWSSARLEGGGAEASAIAIDSTVILGTVAPFIRAKRVGGTSGNTTVILIPSS